MTGLSKRGSGSCINIDGGVRVVSQDLFSLVVVGVYKHSFMCLRTVLVELARVHLVCAKLAAQFEKDGTKIKVSREGFHNRVIEASLRQ